MTAKAPQPMPDRITRENRPKASAAPPPKPPLMRVGCNGNACPLCGSGMKPKGVFGSLIGIFKGCYQPQCKNYWGKGEYTS